MTSIVVPQWQYAYTDGDPVGQPTWLKSSDVIPDARYTETLAIIDTRQRLPEAVHDRKLFIVTGIPGTGKSFALRALCAIAPRTVVFCEARTEATMLSITRTVLRTLGVTYANTRSRDDLTDALLDYLGGLREPVLIIIDECQRMRVDAVDHIRYVHENSPNACFAFIGGYGALEALAADPHMDRRALHRFDFPPLELESSVDYARRYHELWQPAGDKALAQIDAEYCQGRVGYWANITLLGLRLRQRLGEDFRGIDQAFVDDVLIDADKSDHLDPDSDPDQDQDQDAGDRRP